MPQLFDYLARVTSEHADKPRFLAALAIAVQPFADMQTVILGMPSIYDLDNAVGSQLDTVGLWIGVKRAVSILVPPPAAPPILWFAFDSAAGSDGAGFDDGSWYNAGEIPPDASDTVRVNVLGDPAYRVLLRARIVNNHWHGGIEQAYEIWDILFAGTGYSIRLHDNQDMTMEMDLVCPSGGPDPIIKALFFSGYLDIKPAGVTMTQRTVIAGA